MEITTNIGTGIDSLDKILGGWLPCNDITLICGRPGAGKSALAISMALTAAEEGETVLYANLADFEPSYVQNKIVSAATGIPLHLFHKSLFTPDEWASIKTFSQSKVAKNIAVQCFDPQYCDAVDILLAAQKVDATYLVVDYADLMEKATIRDAMKVFWYATQATDLTVVVLGMLSRMTDENNIKIHDIYLYDELYRFAGTTLLISKKDNNLFVEAETEGFTNGSIATKINERTLGVGKWAKEENENVG